MNYMSADDASLVHEAYGPNYARLLELKRHRGKSEGRCCGRARCGRATYRHGAVELASETTFQSTGTRRVHGGDFLPLHHEPTKLTENPYLNRPVCDLG